MCSEDLGRKRRERRFTTRDDLREPPFPRCVYPWTFTTVAGRLWERPSWTMVRTRGSRDEGMKYGRDNMMRGDHGIMINSLVTTTFRPWLGIISSLRCSWVFFVTAANWGGGRMEKVSWNGDARSLGSYYKYSGPSIIRGKWGRKQGWIICNLD